MIRKEITLYREKRTLLIYLKNNIIWRKLLQTAALSRVKARSKNQNAHKPWFGAASE
jgi:hypothetical protein